MFTRERRRSRCRLVSFFQESGHDFEIFQIDVQVRDVEGVLLHAGAVSLEFNSMIVFTLFLHFNMLHQELA